MYAKGNAKSRREAESSCQLTAIKLTANAIKKHITLEMMIYFFVLKIIGLLFLSTFTFVYKFHH